MSDFIRNVSIGEPTDEDYIHREIKVDSDHVDMATYDSQTTEADSLTKKIHDLEEATPDVATASTAGIVKPGNGLKMAETPAGADPDGTLELDAGTLTIYASDGTTVVDTYDGSEDVDITLPTNVPTNHASQNTTYGIGESSKYGHVKITDVYNAAPAAPAGTALSATGGNALYNAVKNGNVHEVTQEEYDNLGDVVKTDGKVYYIKDAPNLGGTFMFPTKQAMEDAIEAGVVFDGAACFVVEDTPYVTNADDVVFDNTSTGLATNVQDALEQTTDNITSLNTVELTNTATHAHAVGEYFLLIGQFVKTTAAIAIGDTITIGTNVTPTNVGAVLNELNSNLNLKITTNGNASSYITLMRMDWNPSGYWQLNIYTADGSGYSIKII